MDKISVALDQPGGLGTIISYLSMLVYNDVSIEIQTNSLSAIMLNDLKNTLMIKNLNIIENDLNTEPHEDLPVSDLNKFLSPYLPIDCIDYRGTQIPLGQGSIHKKAIAFGCYNNSYNKINQEDPRYYTPKEYGLIFSLLKNAGFDILNLDGMGISIADKIYLLNNYCRAVISYEGGLAHLAHILKIPSIILPKKSYVHDTSYVISPNHDLSWRLHLDKKTLFLTNINDILKWSPEFLDRQLVKLDQEQGNNPFLQSTVRYELDGDQILYINHLDNHDFVHRLQLDSFVPPQIFDFYKSKNQILKIGGLKELKNS